MLTSVEKMNAKTFTSCANPSPPQLWFNQSTPPTPEEVNDHYYQSVCDHYNDDYNDTVFNFPKKKNNKIKRGKVIPYQTIQNVNNAVTNPVPQHIITGIVTSCNCNTTPIASGTITFATPTKATITPNNGYIYFTTATGTSANTIWYDPITASTANTNAWTEIKTGQWYTWTTTYTPSDGFAGHIWACPEATKATKLTKEEKEKLVKAEKKSMELLREWLSEAEWNYLMERGELEIPSKIHDDEIYIVKKSAYEKVIKKKKGKKVSYHCIITRGHYPEGDMLLNKIMLLKTDEEQFLKVAVKTPIYDKQQTVVAEPPRPNYNFEVTCTPNGPMRSATYRER